MTADGKVTTKNLGPVDFTSREDKLHLFRQRALADAVLLGHTSLERDNVRLGVPAELQELFLGLGAVNQRAGIVLEKKRAASNTLSRSLLKPDVVALQAELDSWREKLRMLLDAATDELREMNSGWASDRQALMGPLTNLYLKFAYLGRWSAQLDEIAFQLSG